MLSTRRNRCLRRCSSNYSRQRGALPVSYTHLGAAYWFTASTSFANPAITIARSLTNTFSGIRPGDMPAFILAQFVGALAALAAARALFPVKKAKAPPTDIKCIVEHTATEKAEALDV